jgi:hypothetical protein
MKRSNLIRIFFFTAAAALLLAGCQNNPLAQPTATLPPTPIPTATVPPTPTPLPEKAVLVGGTERSFSAIQTVMQELAAGSGLVFESRPAVETADITPDWKVAVFLSVPGNLPDLLAAAPETQFVIISPVDIQSGANLTVLRERREMQAFAAGYTTALAGYDWRAAGLLPSDTPLGESLTDAFRNGQIYFCGTCNTYYAPYANFPLVKALPSASSTADWQTAMQEIALNYVYSVYVAPEAATPEFYSYLITLNVPIIGGTTPPDEVRPLYAATVQIDLTSPLREVWGELVSGQGGKTINAAIQISDVNPDLLTPGRQMRAEMTIEELMNGLIDPFSPPLE